VLRITLIGDGTEILGDFAIEVPVPTDRGCWKDISARVDLMAASGSVGFSVAIKEREAAERARTAILNELSECGFSYIAAKLVGPDTA
jgi:hypothetical protein